jgi:hypothetical protein
MFALLLPTRRSSRTDFPLGRASRIPLDHTPPPSPIEVFITPTAAKTAVSPVSSPETVVGKRRFLGESPTAVGAALEEDETAVEDYETPPTVARDRSTAVCQWPEPGGGFDASDGVPPDTSNGVPLDPSNLFSTDISSNGVSPDPSPAALPRLRDAPTQAPLRASSASSSPQAPLRASSASSSPQAPLRASSASSNTRTGLCSSRSEVSDDISTYLSDAATATALTSLYSGRLSRSRTVSLWRWNSAAEKAQQPQRSKSAGEKAQNSPRGGSKPDAKRDLSLSSALSRMLSLGGGGEGSKSRFQNSVKGTPISSLDQLYAQARGVDPYLREKVCCQTLGPGP